MDPQACFRRFLGAVLDGELDDAAEAAEDYAAWMRKGGFPAIDGEAKVLRLDVEQDRYLVDDDGLERWRDVQLDDVWCRYCGQPDATGAGAHDACEGEP